MKWTRQVAALAVAGCVCALAGAQDYHDEETEPPRRTSANPEAGFWPTPVMIELFIDRTTEEMARSFDFDDDQLYQTRELLKERIPRWMNENRGEIMQLTNEYLEALLDKRAPDPADVATWAQRVLPLLGDVAGLTEDIADEMRTFLTADQQLILNSHLAAARVATSFVTQRLTVWAEGGFDPDTEFIHGKHFKEANERQQKDLAEAQNRARREAMGIASNETGGSQQMAGSSNSKAPRTAEPRLDEWDRYVADFIRRYQLNDTQKASAHKYLRFQKDRRETYLRRKGTELAAAERAVREATSDQERSKLERMHAQLKKPLDRMFTQFKEKLEKIPTRKQRLAAAQPEPGQSQPQPAVTGSTATAGAGKRD